MIVSLLDVRHSVADDLRDIFRPTAAPPPRAHGAEPVFALAPPPARRRPNRATPMLIATLGLTSATAVAWILPPLPAQDTFIAEQRSVPLTLAISKVAEAPTAITAAASPPTAAETEITPARPRAAVAIAAAPQAVFASSDNAMGTVSSPCDDLEAGGAAWCLRPAVLQADSTLREAYAVAIDAGVDRKMLKAYRSSWSRLRRKAPDDPRQVIDGYERMARELQSEALQRRARRV